MKKSYSILTVIFFCIIYLSLNSELEFNSLIPKTKASLLDSQLNTAVSEASEKYILIYDYKNNINIELTKSDFIYLDTYTVKTNWILYSKCEEIKHPSYFSLNYLSTFVDPFPYFDASRKSNHAFHASQLWTGKSTSDMGYQGVLVQIQSVRQFKLTT